MNKKHWNDLYLYMLDDAFVREQILKSYNLVAAKLPKSIKQQLNAKSSL